MIHRVCDCRTADRAVTVQRRSPVLGVHLRFTQELTKKQIDPARAARSCPTTSSEICGAYVTPNAETSSEAW
jgi:hypothetical protein